MQDRFGQDALPRFDFSCYTIYFLVSPVLFKGNDGGDAYRNGDCDGGWRRQWPGAKVILTMMAMNAGDDDGTYINSLYNFIEIANFFASCEDEPTKG